MGDVLPFRRKDGTCPACPGCGALPPMARHVVFVEKIEELDVCNLVIAFDYTCRCGKRLRYAPALSDEGG